MNTETYYITNKEESLIIHHISDMNYVTQFISGVYAASIKNDVDKLKLICKAGAGKHAVFSWYEKLQSYNIGYWYLNNISVPKFANEFIIKKANIQIETKTIDNQCILNYQIKEKQELIEKIKENIHKIPLDTLQQILQN